jgi:hypothetical protein
MGGGVLKPQAHLVVFLRVTQTLLHRRQVACVDVGSYHAERVADLPGDAIPAFDVKTRGVQVREQEMQCT